MARKCECDRCGHQAETTDGGILLGWSRPDIPSAISDRWGHGHATQATVDLCPDCTRALHKFIARLPQKVDIAR